MDALRSQRHQPKDSRCNTGLTGDLHLQLILGMATGIRAVPYSVSSDTHCMPVCKQINQSIQSVMADIFKSSCGRHL